MHFNEKVKKLRLDARLTQQQVADALDVSRQAVRAWETGRARPRYDKMRQLADLLGVRMYDLVSEDLSDGEPYGVSGTQMPFHAQGIEASSRGGVEDMPEVPSAIARRHPHGFLFRMDDASMDRLYPKDCLLLIDPDMKHVNGAAVLVETQEHGALVRHLTVGQTYSMLTAASSAGDHPDIIIGPDDEPITIKGRVVWYMRDRDDRE